ncbi:ArsR/SmtB family transcription factor [Rhizobium brockwellii]|jgi:ArsR family transcriptional regulator|uniref:Metalloregulator ArsR/SmtB family transcription factor n=2 Tax=Rhizobium TaxID=379 RepID=A0ABU3YF33_9HYPH|nr:MULTISPECIES: metalloregulator ArsR/SmtB family transcription factor [Rhizobium]MDV4177410.1 metalloregulator ArsR/SmtB family transcription factor [Rhizobium brockwellii]MDV4184409.1 metalloregulator ArsR/SmtB family transcription factor [Rhizobium brockwellii]NZD53009.1 helix-turn-helix transcriptional regulator [Rhizobium leguminosarum]QIO50817.1 helix-turn-helix transcriptional regulator [Rhizobium leguminosarum bv. trifolii]TAV49785.1 transcriptional regulator [Rhizobium leguminosarum]
MDKDEIIKALAHPARMDILNWLKNPEEHFPSQEHPIEMGVCASQFERCGLSQSTVSAHLGTLHRAGLVTTKRVGQWIFYKRNEETIAAFLKQLTQDL